MTDRLDRHTFSRQLDTEGENPSEQVAQAVADIEGTDATELSTMYARLNGVLDDIFSDPPAPEANLLVEFDFEGYRITVEQDGTATFEELE